MYVVNFFAQLFVAAILLNGSTVGAAVAPVPIQEARR